MIKIAKLLFAVVFTLLAVGRAEAFRAFELDPTHFANLGPEIDGVAQYCDDCTKTVGCAGGGTGAWGFGLNGAWSCALASSSLSITMVGDVTGASDANLVKGAHYALTTVSDGTTPYTVLGTDTFLAGNGSSGNVTANLPASLGDGKLYIFKNASASRTFVIHPNGTDTIEGVNANVTLSLQNQALAIVSTASGVWVEVQFPLTLVSGGGTGLSAGTSGGIPYFASASTMASSAALTNHGVVIGGGAGATPKTIAVCASNTGLWGVTGSDPTCRAVDVSTADITGIEKSANGGTGSDLSGAASGKYPKSNGAAPAVFAASTLAASGIGACSASNWASTLNGDAAPTCTQPAFTDISGTVGAAQLSAQSSIAAFYRTMWGGGAATGLSVSNGVTNFFPITGSYNAGTIEAVVAAMASLAATAKNLRCIVTTAPGASNSYKFTLRLCPAGVSCADTASTCTVSGTTPATCSDLTHSIAISAGDTLDMSSLTTVGGAAPTSSGARCGIELDI